MRYLNASLMDVLNAAPNQEYMIWTDGSGSGRGQSTGSGAIAIWKPKRKHAEGAWMIKVGFAPGQLLAPQGSTNNTAELMAIRTGLALFRATTPLVKITGEFPNPFRHYRTKKITPEGMVTLWSDSEWCIKSIKGIYRRVTKNLELISSCQKAVARWEKVTFQHVRGHRGHYQNEICDRLAKEARAHAGPAKTYVGFIRFDIHTICDGEETVATLDSRELCLKNGTLKILAPNLGPKSSFFRSLARTTSTGGDF